jgi:hypothetical protein
MDLRDKSIDDLVNAVQTSVLAPSSNNPQSIMAVVARCTIELSDRADQLSKGINQVSKDINNAKRAFLEMFADLTTQLKKTHESISAGSAEASRGTEALVRWTRVLVFATIAYVVITGLLLLASVYH